MKLFLQNCRNKFKSPLMSSFISRNHPQRPFQVPLTLAHPQVSGRPVTLHCDGLSLHKTGGACKKGTMSNSDPWSKWCMCVSGIGLRALKILQQDEMSAHVQELTVKWGKEECEPTAVWCNGGLWHLSRPGPLSWATSPATGTLAADSREPRARFFESPVSSGEFERQ